MKSLLWLIVAIPAGWVVVTLGWWLANVLLNWLTPWFSMPAPAFTRGELTLILLCLAMVCVSWNDRR